MDELDYVFRLGKIAGLIEELISDEFYQPSYLQRLEERFFMNKLTDDINRIHEKLISLRQEVGHFDEY